MKIINLLILLLVITAFIGCRAATPVDDTVDVPPVKDVPAQDTEADEQEVEESLSDDWIDEEEELDIGEMI